MRRKKFKYESFSEQSGRPPLKEINHGLENIGN